MHKSSVERKEYEITDKKVKKVNMYPNTIL